jgi:hypothetical protein
LPTGEINFNSIGICIIRFLNGNLHPLIPHS